MSTCNNRKWFTIYHNGVSPIVVLLLAGRPLAVVGFVVALVVDPIQALSLGSVAHILVEVLELSPPLANSNPPTTVIMVVFVLRILAPLQHSYPRLIDRRAFHAVGFTKATATFTLLGVAQPHFARLAASRTLDLYPLVNLAGIPDSLKLADHYHHSYPMMTSWSTYARMTP